MDERWYVTEHDLGTSDLNLKPIVYAGPYNSREEAEENMPRDGDGFEYMVESLTEQDIELHYD